jgi:hypothetical protein
MENEKLISVSEAAKLMNVSKSQIYKAIPTMRQFGLQVFKVLPNASPRFTKENLLETASRIANQGA